MKYEMLFFDLDHTLWDFESNAYDTMQDLYNLHQLKDKGIKDFSLFFEHYSIHNTRLWDMYTKGQIEQDILKWKRIWLTLNDFSIDNALLSQTMSKEFLDILPKKTKLLPDAINTLEYLKNKGYMMSLLTNGFEKIQQEKVKNSRIEHFFENIITSERSTYLKPNPGIFYYAMNFCGVQGNKTIMIGDNQDADIQGGINAGIDTIWINAEKKKPHVKATYEVNCLRDLKTIL